MQLKGLLNTVYFGADHVVWASQAGILGDKLLVDRAQKIRYYSCLRLQCTHFKFGYLWHQVGQVGILGDTLLVDRAKKISCCCDAALGCGVGM